MKDKFEEIAIEVVSKMTGSKVIIGKYELEWKENIALALKRVEKEGFDRGFSAGLEKAAELVELGHTLRRSLKQGGE